MVNHAPQPAVAVVTRRGFGVGGKVECVAVLGEGGKL